MEEEGESRNQSQSQQENNKAERIRRVTSLAIGIILFIVVVIYAGVRGQYAYNNLPATIINFEPMASLDFPAITFCPLVPTVLKPVLCVKETALVEVADCSTTAYTRSFNIEGLYHQCITFNDPQDGSPRLTSLSLDDEVAIRVYINASQVPPDEPIGALVMVHVQGVDPVLDDQNSFVSDIGKLTEVWLSLDTGTTPDGTEFVSKYYRAVASYVTYQEVNPGDSKSIMDVDFQFAKQGVYDYEQYYVYAPNNWIGEVGGLAFLLWFLHWAVVTTVGAIASRFFGKKYLNVA